MAKYKCAGKFLKPPDCTHEDDARWLGRCPICRRYRNIITREPAKAGTVTTAATAASAKPIVYIPTGIGEFDQVIGGGLVLGGGTILFGGERGQGKSTILLQVLDG